MALMINFLKNLFGDRATKQAQPKTEARKESDSVASRNSPASTSLNQYTGPKEFANKPAVDYLIKHVKYQPLRELTGRAIHFQSLFTIDDDIQKALKDEYPYIGGITFRERLRPTWHGSLVSPKYIHFSEQLMEVDFETSNAECRTIKLDDLEYLGFLDQSTDEWLHNEQYSREVFTLDDLGYQLEPSTDQVYLHLIIDNGQPWNERNKTVSHKLQKAVTARTNNLAAKESANFNPLWQAIIEVYNEKFFPAELIVREACLTNLLKEGESCIYSHRYFYF